MSIEIDQKQWDAFVLTNGPRSGRFLQSFAWGEFQKAVGRHVHREILDVSERVVGLAQTVRHTFPLLGWYDYIARGPIVEEVSKLPEMMTKLVDANVFLRFDPAFDPLIMLPKSRLQKTIDVQPAHTVVNDLRFSEEQLRQGMHAKTRYNIGLAEKKDLSLKFQDVNISEVWSLFDETSKRGSFRLHARAYYHTMLDHLHNKTPRVFLAAAYLDETPIAATIMLDFGDTRTYLHGASSHKHRALMASSLLHWKLLLDAKAQGMHWYDWWGVCPLDAKNHPWEGISRFKRGFGGEELVYPGTYDVVMKPLTYAVYNTARRVRRMF